MYKYYTSSDMKLALITYVREVEVVNRLILIPTLINVYHCGPKLINIDQRR